MSEKELSDKDKEELLQLYDEEFKKVVFLAKERGGINAGIMTLFLYLSSKNLEKQSSRLTWLTWALIGTSAGMIGLAIAQLVAILIK